MGIALADTSGVLLAKFVLTDPNFFNGIIGPLLLVIAVWIGAKAYRDTKTTEAGIATSGLLTTELQVARERADRLADELTKLHAELAECNHKTSLEPVMAGLGEVLTMLTSATNEMVAEVKASTAQAAQRHEVVMKAVAVHEQQAAERHARMMVPLQKMADTLGERAA